MNDFQKCLPAGLIAATLLTACGGGGGDAGKPAPLPTPDPVARVDILMSNERGMKAVTIDDKNAYVALTNTEAEGTAVIATARGVSARSAWQNVALGECKLPASAQVEVRRAADLRAGRQDHAGAERLGQRRRTHFMRARPGQDDLRSQGQRLPHLLRDLLRTHGGQ
ncbi:hypothetical protein F0185_27190 [Massilia sp. CCM 8692]|uniref:Lipoprotein n=1 Tax=Massilia rubra TaxID=2607910 RepID=A0ABX0LTE3_9BURK|nr:hypothetical protein [Massilia rubra]